jgi:hypothetical protein
VTFSKVVTIWVLLMASHNNPSLIIPPETSNTTSFISASDFHIEYTLGRDRQWALDSVRRSTEFAKNHDLYVSVNAEGASRSVPGVLIESALAAREAGADGVRFCYTVGILDPFETYKRAKALIQEVDIRARDPTPGGKCSRSWPLTPLGASCDSGHVPRTTGPDATGLWEKSGDLSCGRIPRFVCA